MRFFIFASEKHKNSRRIHLKTHKNNKKPAKMTGLMWWEKGRSAGCERWGMRASGWGDMRSRWMVTSVRQPPTASAAADQASQFRLSNGFEWTFWRSPVKSCCVSFLTVVRNWGQYDRFAPGDFLLFATRLGFSHLVTSRMFTNYHYSALTTLFYRETFADSRAIDPNHVNDTHKQQELSLT